jgi:hypothetical protein
MVKAINKAALPIWVRIMYLLPHEGDYGTYSCLEQF